MQSDLYYPRYLGVLSFGLKNRGLTRFADNRGLTVDGVKCSLFNILTFISLRRTPLNLCKSE